jgi:hypothetical protein
MRILQVNLDTIPVINFVVTSIGNSTIETKEPDRIGYNWFLFQHEYSGEGRGANSFVSIIMYLTCTIIVLLKKYMLWHMFLHFSCLESQIRQQLTKIKRQIFKPLLLFQ